MKTSIIATLLLSGSICVASAANLGAALGKETIDWSGAYAGIYLGYGWGDSDFIDSEYNGIPPFYPTVRWGTGSKGTLAGVSVGHNWRHNNIVFGIEGEIGRLNLNGKSLQPGVDPYGLPYDASGTVDGGWHGGLSARLGYTLDRTLLYAKASLAYSGSKLGFLDICTVSPCGDSIINASEKVGWGYQLGAGLEHAVTHRWTVKAEYVYLDFGDFTISGKAIGGALDGNVYNISSDMSVHTVRIGANYKF